ncbi:unannotated protein [freshwater metagenome]|uniref:Unannotated protein n=1 Tax=freshwater metagenome TaxID=449393 RepID=A0A6J6B298_9ZZZZ
MSAALIVTSLKFASPEPVILATFKTTTVSRTKYALPVSLLCTAIREEFESAVLTNTIATFGPAASIITFKAEAAERLPATSAA